MKNVIYIALFWVTSIAVGQTVKGVVANQNKTPVEYMFVVNQKTQEHAHTNFKGEFRLANTYVGDTIIFQKIGFNPKKIVCTSAIVNVQVTTQSIALEQVVLTSGVSASSVITAIDVETNPVKSAQELLTKVPGLIIGQHAGGGKAEQIFYRGFDIDHGTDLQVNVDGLPVNMVSHAHGQGYADLHFVIPETIKNLDFKAGTYNAKQGNFATTGTVNISSKERLSDNRIKLEVGDFNSQRLLFMNQFINKTNESAYVATEYIKSDGPFESPQNFKRFNINSKYIKRIEDTQLAFTFSHFESNWNASGQIPERAVNNGSISRFGAIDDTEGGETARTNIALAITNSYSDNSELKHLLYYTNYQFDLYSNFTFFLENPVDGDQIHQKENRAIFGYQSDYKKQLNIANKEILFSAGLGVRADKVKDNQLSSTKNKTEILERIQYGDVNETNFFGYVSGDIELGKWNIIPALRVDYFSFGYQDFLSTDNKLKEQTSAVVSPKLSVLYTPVNSFQAYVKLGQGFHTNDSRLVLNSLGNDIPKAYTTDVGFVWRADPKVLIGLGAWAMYSEQEFVYVGDAGVVEPNGASERVGLSLNTRLQPTRNLFVNFDANYTHARFANEPNGEDYVPLAPSFTLKGGITYKKDKGFYGGIDFLHLTDRPANEDNSIVADGYTLTNLNAGYRWNKVELGIQIQNLFDVEWNETQFATESKLANETNSVEEIHFTPGTPLFVKSSITYKF
ncbi:outer membrane receptor for Fe3+-dicitrate [Wenyingzhuangia heitensis]|uniref:Outer membrane receptor for Fe3+-dicitrate n=1 Tax=Wenyingzhuangia heitensis TaxID=1487859 RepID=A0ABX0U5C4_9FLAO|nr:TonB-dependent receptor [Wenyingzhuangia heitensis]NIJ44054.1 outer membrane receptor for Fe3+-dicitrate [Wenyingzhuangia heitensis]